MTLGTPALGACAYDDDSTVVDTTEDLEQDSATDEPVVKLRKPSSFAKVVLTGMVLGVGVGNVMLIVASPCLVNDSPLCEDSYLRWYYLGNVAFAGVGAALASLGYFIVGLF